jgi:hypothetical protein
MLSQGLQPIDDVMQMVFQTCASGYFTSSLRESSNSSIESPPKQGPSDELFKACPTRPGSAPSQILVLG